MRKIEFQLEQIKDTRYQSYTYRAKVIGGWILHSLTEAGGKNSQSMVFIPDPNHDWII